MKLLIGLAAMLALAAPQQLSAARSSSIEMETTSWGRLVARWSLDDTGLLRYTSPEPGVFDAKRIVTRHYRVGLAGFRRMRALLGSAESQAGRPMRCTQAVTDAVYGKLSWRTNARVRKLSFYTACSEPATTRIVAQIGQADQLARQWAMRGEVVETRPGERAQ